MEGEDEWNGKECKRVGGREGQALPFHRAVHCQRKLLEPANVVFPGWGVPEAGTELGRVVD